jgi:DNA-binding NarL/FixJ family response regulator
MEKDQMDRIKILIVDDQALFASSLKIVLDNYVSRGLSVVGIAHDGRECIELLQSVTADIILMDVRMPVLDGVETTKIVHEKYPKIRIMMLTTFDDDTYVQQALSNGATGYVLKNIEPEELLVCIEAVCKGTLLVSASVGYRFYGSPLSDLDSDPERARLLRKIAYLQSRFPDLKRREAEVLCLILQGMDNTQISQKMFIAGQTVKNYTSMIYAKIGVDDRLHAIRLLGSLE